jgi:hypothetical protein
MELPNPPWYRRWSVILAGVIGVAAVAAVVGVLGFRGADGPDPGPDVASPAPTTTVTSTTAAAPPTTRQPQSTLAPGILWTKTDTDNAKSRGFRAPSAWHIEWSFDCSNFKRYGGGNFKITGDGDFEEIQIQEVDDEASGSRTFNRGGYGHLMVESVCKRWTVTAVAD